MTDNSKEAYMSEIKPVYQRRIQDDDWQEIEHSEYMEFSERGKFQTRILYPSAALDALQRQNNALKLMCESKANQLTIIDKEVTRLRSLDTDNKGLKECNAILTEEHAAQAKRIAELELSATRYEKLRRLNAYQFQNIFKQNITSCARFDDLVDNLSAQKGTE